ncbi:MAG: hypothetical protein E7164_00405 [Firmicutes bacterium]|nr:hypothetical protein [Bacillota bacterium]
MSRDYKKEFEDRCLTCKKYDIYSKSDATVRGFRCKRLLRPVAMDSHCYQYDEDRIRSNSSIEDAVEWILRRGYDPRPDCYVTTAICEILGMPYNHEYITNFKRLRSEYMESFAEGKKLIDAYDVYGLMIAEELRKRYSNSETKEATLKAIRDVLEPGYLATVNSLIKSGNMPMAMYTYFQMINMLAMQYNIDYTFNVEQVELEQTAEYSRGTSYQGA